MSGQVRLRFAPSPTGYLHLGSARTALFNWLHARHTGGKLILRIEDTDKERSKKEFLDEILEDLKWMGLNWDEGPFFQSERGELYREKAEEMLGKGLAYREGNAIIFRVPKDKGIKIDDVVHGQIEFNTKEIKDQVLIKSDGSAAYNFACVVDDDNMGITHIIRGDDHISNTPKQTLFYEALGLKVPIFAHMPLMMGKDGSKLSKRHGGVAVFEYKEQGFLPESLANYLLLLGWSPKDGREIMSLADAIKIFNIENISQVQVRFDIDKLKWLNGEYVKAKPIEDLFVVVDEKLKKLGYLDIEKAYLLRVIELYKERFKTLDELTGLTEFFFKDDYAVDEKAYKKYLENDEAKGILNKFTERLEKLNEFTAHSIESVCREFSEELNIKTAQIIHPTRVAVSGITKGAGLFEMMELLGKERVIQRLKKAIQFTA